MARSARQLEKYFQAKSTIFANERFTAYLTNRKQFYHWDGANSSRDSLKCVIPQGSCFGPLLFLLYVNDFENCLEYMTPDMIHM